MKQKIKISIPSAVLLSNLRLVHRIMDKLEQVSGEKFPTLNPADMVMDLETKAMTIKTSLVDGMTVEMDTEFFNEILSIHGDIAMAMIDATVIVKTAVEKATKDCDKITEKWIMDEPKEEPKSDMEQSAERLAKSFDDLGESVENLNKKKTNVFGI